VRFNSSGWGPTGLLRGFCVISRIGAHRPGPKLHAADACSNAGELVSIDFGIAR
jgi:hypothetical protein